MAYERKTDRPINYLKDSIPLAREFGFGGTEDNTVVGNPYLCLEGNISLILLAGGLLGLVTTSRHFKDEELYKPKWKSNRRNTSHATITTTKYPTEEEKLQGVAPCTLIYYRVMFRSSIAATAEDFMIPAESVFIDHKNHMRGDCRVENLQPASAMQNQRNRSKVKITKAFYTFDDLRDKLASGEWVPLANQAFDYIQSII
jgi:hypothetical protein